MRGRGTAAPQKLNSWKAEHRLYTGSVWSCISE